MYDDGSLVSCFVRSVSVVLFLWSFCVVFSSVSVLKNDFASLIEKRDTNWTAKLEGVCNGSLVVSFVFAVMLLSDGHVRGPYPAAKGDDE